MVRHPELWKAVAILFPNAPRTAYTLFDPGTGQAEILAWNEATMGGPIPDDAALLAAIAAYDAQQAQQATDAATLRQAVIAALPVGIAANNWTATQRNATIAALAYAVGALYPDLTMKPPGQWLK